MEKYDVFISCKSEDYENAEEIYNFLNENGINTFIASQELRKMGESEYRKAISNALKEAEHMIVFASKAEYIESRWVEFEWDMFLNAKLKGRKDGNLITILKDVRTDDIPMDLWKYESFTFDDYKSKILKYVETEASKEREDGQKKILENELKQALEVYNNTLTKLKGDADKIYGILIQMGITERECPVCKRKLPIETSICPSCGWQTSSLDEIEELDNLDIWNTQKNNAHEIYQTLYNDYIGLKNSITQKSQEPKDEKPKEIDLQTPNNPKKEIHLNAVNVSNVSLKDDDLVIDVPTKGVKFKKVEFEGGEFFITSEALPLWICEDLGKKKYINFFSKNNMLSREAFVEILTMLKNKTGLKWDIPTLQEWCAAYDAKVIKRSYGDLCLDQNGQSLAIQKPDRYFAIQDSNSGQTLHPVIRLKDNPGLQKFLDR